MHSDPDPRHMAPSYPKGLAAWRPVLERLSFPPHLAMRIAERAAANGTDFLTELSATGLVAESRLYRAIADAFGIDYLDCPDPSRIILSDGRAMSLLGLPQDAQTVRLVGADGVARVAIAPLRFTDRSAHVLESAPPLVRKRLLLTPPARLRAALVTLAERRLIENACNRLYDAFPIFSARQVATAGQGAVIGVLSVVLLVALIVANAGTMLALHLAGSLLFLSCVMLRIPAATHAVPPRLGRVAPAPIADAPVYSVLVALYHEAEIVPELLVALGRLQWPRSRLEIKLVCEADDQATLAAIEAQSLRPYVEVVRVPTFGPRTKPKALAYALPFTSGEFITLYDAEDRPHPLQLAEAWRRFSEAEENLACLQAPLVVANAPESLIARSFAFEYAALFRGLLPWLSARGLVLPLGGTSNHFRREALEDVCGWDPYNVTEDADLGLRLARFGYRTETITHPTLEDGPVDIATWLPQRTRWLKGWLQSWLVQMRDPAGAIRDLGLRSFLAAQILSVGMVASALVHPLFVGSALWLAVAFFVDPDFAVLHSAMLLIDIVNIALGYTAFLVLGFRTLHPAEKRGFWRVALFTPFYWLLMSAAAWRAVFQLMTRPHYWEKTPHRPRRTASGSGRRA